MLRESARKMSSSNKKDPSQSKPALSPQAQRALEEAALRRKNIDKAAKKRPPERDGRDGPEPTRYGDWEKNGIISDF